MSSHRAKLLASGLTLTSIGGSIATVATARQDLRDLFGQPVGLAIVAFVGGALMVVLGVIALALWALAGTVALVQSARSAIASRSILGTHFTCRMAQAEDLPRLHDLIRDMLGEGVASLGQLQERFAKNSELFWLIEPAADGKPRPPACIAGYFILLPLTKRAAELVDRGALNGRTFKPGDIMTPKGRPGAVYIGGVAAKGRTAQGAVMAYLRDCLREYRKRGAQRAYARPVTPVGLALLQRYRFEPVGPEEPSPLGRMHRLDLGQIG
jgi:hypothetical protein